MLLTRPPLDPKVSFDLHVLSTPPAFVLSQDQTLRKEFLVSFSSRLGETESFGSTYFS